MTQELLIPCFENFCCGFWVIFGVSLVCLEVLLWKEHFLYMETGLLSITVYLGSFIVVL